MKHIKLFESFDSDELNQDIEGLLVELKDDNIISYDIYNGKSPSGKIFKTVSFSTNGNSDCFYITEIYNEIKTIEDYLKEKGYTYNYNYEYFDDDEDENFIKSCRSVSQLHKAHICDGKIKIMNLHLIIH